MTELSELPGKTYETLSQRAYTTDPNDIFASVANAFYMLGSVTITSQLD